MSPISAVSSPIVVNSPLLAVRGFRGPLRGVRRINLGNWNLAVPGVKTVPSIYIPFLVLWVLMAIPVVGLIIYRKSVAQQEDDSLKLSQNSQGATAQQIGVAHRLEQIDKWGKILTAVVVAYGVVLLAVFLYRGWVVGPAGV